MDSRSPSMSYGLAQASDIYGDGSVYAYPGSPTLVHEITPTESAISKGAVRDWYLSKVIDPALSGNTASSRARDLAYDSLLTRRISSAASADSVGDAALRGRWSPEDYYRVQQQNAASGRPGFLDSAESVIDKAIADAADRAFASAAGDGATSGASVGHSSGAGYYPEPAVNYLYADLAKAYGMDASTAYQEALSNTSYQRAVKDLQAAGLNPALLYGNLSGAGGVYGAHQAGSSGSGMYYNKQTGASTGASSAKGNHFWYKLLRPIMTITGGVIGSVITGSPAGAVAGATGGNLIGGAGGNLLDMM